jgi:hypothetical protein
MESGGASFEARNHSCMYCDDGLPRIPCTRTHRHHGVITADRRRHVTACFIRSHSEMTR